MTPEEAQAWRPQIQFRSLASRVLAVAQTRIEGTWAAYCDAVPGYSHQHEFVEVLRVGDKLPEEIAIALFPYFATLPYAH